MRERDRTAEPTTDWMVRDIADRCREVLASLETTESSAAHLGNAAVLLRSAADDLVSLVELVEGADRADGERGDVPPQAFGLSFGTDQPADG